MSETSKIPTVIINDCRDANAAGRQAARMLSLTGGAISFMGVANDLEAAGNLIDILDAFEDRPGIILVNVAPRSGAAKKWENGTPFGYFRYRNALVLASIDGFTLSLVKKLALAQEIIVFDIPHTLDRLIAEGYLEKEKKAWIVGTQFRSFDFLPRAGAYLSLSQEHELAGERLPIAEIPDAPKTIWWIDNFGNYKTTLLAEEMEEITGGKNTAGFPATIQTRLGELPFLARLKDVPDGSAAIITGSSGIGEKRFLEIVAQDVNGSAHKKFNLSVGAEIL